MPLVMATTNNLVLGFLLTEGIKNMLEAPCRLRHIRAKHSGWSFTQQPDFNSRCVTEIHGRYAPKIPPQNSPLTNLENSCYNAAEGEPHGSPLFARLQANRSRTMYSVDLFVMVSGVLF
jgi:hypothetical protein